MDAVTESGADRAYRAGVDFFLGPLVDLLNDESVTEIMVNGPRDVYVERGGQIEQVDAAFEVRVWERCCDAPGSRASGGR